MDSGGVKELLWALPEHEVLKKLESSDKGLNSDDALSRINKYGYNEIKTNGRRNWSDILVSQFKSPLIFTLVIAAVISYFLGEHTEAIVIIVIVLLNSFLGFFQEYKAEKVVEELRKYITLKAKVLRDGEEEEVDAKNLVPGDIVLLNLGDIVTADIRLVHVDELVTDESVLTGESVPVLKEVKTSNETRSLPQYLRNVAFMGTSVASGEGRGVVIQTGENTFMGSMATKIKQKAHEDEFQKNIRTFSDMLLKVILLMTVFIFIANAVLGKGIFESFLFAVALAVGIIPEALPIIITITLSNGAIFMAKKKVVVKKLSSLEDFGNIDTVCCDKTGTLTNNNFELVDYLNSEGKRSEKVLLYGLLCNTSKQVKQVKQVKKGGFFGNYIDKAIWESKFAKDFEKKIDNYDELDTNEFDFKRKRMSVLVRMGKENVLIAKGAPEWILEVCTNFDHSVITKEKLAEIKKRVLSYESQGFTIISVASKIIEKKDITKSDECRMNFEGFLIFIDPPKKSAKESIMSLKKLGVSIKIITGDSPLVTRKICEEVGFQIVDNTVITGEELDKLKDGVFEEYVSKYNVFARIDPDKKYRIVEVLNKEGHIVGFLGDGANDAPALRAADVGISVDSGTGIAKEAADVILLNKSLEVLTEGIKEGRKIFANITKYILNTISANFGNMFTVAASSLFLNFIPLLPSQILLNNFVSDIPLLTIVTDNVDEEFLKKPKKWDISFISKFMVYFGGISTFFDLVLIFGLMYLFNANVELFRTAWFIESALSEIIITFAIRTRLSLFKSKPSSWLLLASIITIIFTFVITYTVIGKDLFEFVYMPINILLFVSGVLIAYFITAELAKKLFYKNTGV
ncbi:Copper-exporting P-type ATPase B [Candidatus Tiddalikarchaeum anstoanum]|nr:Copper-exporting P-type ATPase B [Candidatus Tiddalikarchaeum anstoanum]